MIIYLNGPTSSGKSSLLQALQERLEEPYLSIGIDKVIGLMPQGINDWTGGEAPLGYSWKQQRDRDGHPVAVITAGPFAERMEKTYREIVLTLARMGHNFMIDDVALEVGEVDRWRSLLADYRVLYVGVRAPLELLEERERQRGDRMVGSARDQYYRTHRGESYDLEIETSELTPDEGAEQIVRALG